MHPSTHLPIHYSIHPFIHPPARLSIHSFTPPSIFPAVCTFLYLPICSFIHPSIHSPVHPFIHLSVCSSAHPSIHLFIHPSPTLLPSEHVPRSVCASCGPFPRPLLQIGCGIWETLGGLSFILWKAPHAICSASFPGTRPVCQQQRHSVRPEGQSRLSHQPEVPGESPKLLLGNAIIQ